MKVTIEISHDKLVELLAEAIDDKRLEFKNWTLRDVSTSVVNEIINGFKGSPSEQSRFIAERLLKDMVKK